MGKRQHETRRALARLEEAVLLGDAPVGEDELRAALAEVEAERVEALVRRDGYAERYDVCGVRRHVTSAGRVIFSMAIETFPDHVNNVYLILDGSHRLLFDAGTEMPSAKADFARAGRVLERIHGLPGILDGIPDLLVSHAHSDHFAGVGRWKAAGARLHIHELDARVLENFEERIILSARALRTFWQAAGVPDGERAELERMYTGTKSLFRSVPVDHTFADGAALFGGVAHHVPGHCPGQIVFQLDDVLLTADHVLSRITPHQSPESLAQSNGLDHYLESLQKVRRLSGITLALPAHEVPITDLAGRIGEIEAFHRARLDKVRAILRERGPLTLVSLSEAMFGPQVGYGRLLAFQEAGAHVEWLMRRGHVEIDNLDAFTTHDNPVVVYRAGRS